MTAPKTPPDCHPDRKHVGRGLCMPCYDWNRARGWPNGKPALRPVDAIKPSCHPDRPHQARGRCVTCYEAYRVARDARPKGPQWRTASKLRAYGMTPAQYNDMADAQGRRCAICRDEGLLCVDHDHDTGVVRGLLCGNCNRALGQLKDSPQRARAAASYLESHACSTKQTA
ncbi:MAG: hypothetical protein NVS2B6_17170 [Thermoleophilaceae bacterium]